MQARHILTLALSVAFLCGSAHANSIEVNEFCRHADLNSFIVTGFDQLPDNKDFCRVSTTEIPPVIRKMLPWTARQNRRLERFFGMPVSELFPSGLNLRLEGSSWPDAYFAPKTIILGHYSDWNPASEGNVWDDFTYLHEAAHLLQLDPLSRTPSAIRALARRNVFFETFPDFVAFAITGKRSYFNRAEGMPSCFDYGRQLTQDYSFTQPYGVFTYYPLLGPTLACCKRLDRAGTHVPRTLGVCKSVREAMDTLFKDVYPSMSELNELFNPAKHCLDSNGKYSVLRCNDHHLGTVTNSFFFHFQAAARVAVGPLYLNALSRISSAPSFAHLAKTFRASLSRDHRDLFDLLWEVHTMDTAIALERMQPR